MIFQICKSNCLWFANGCSLVINDSSTRFGKKRDNLALFSIITIMSSIMMSGYFDDIELHFDLVYNRICPIVWCGQCFDNYLYSSWVYVYTCNIVIIKMGIIKRTPTWITCYQRLHKCKLYLCIIFVFIVLWWEAKCNCLQL